MCHKDSVVSPSYLNLVDICDYAWHDLFFLYIVIEIRDSIHDSFLRFLHKFLIIINEPCHIKLVESKIKWEEDSQCSIHMFAVLNLTNSSYSHKHLWEAVLQKSLEARQIYIEQNQVTFTTSKNDNWIKLM